MCEVTQRDYDEKFQSHNGAIAALPVSNTSIVVICFNPTMVRLLLLPASHSSPSSSQFQSHNGAIAAPFHSWRRKQNCAVSIPQWCDCCVRSSQLCCQWSHVSIPQWCDCCPVAETDAQTKMLTFQSHNGAIAAWEFNLLRLFFRQVSIPQWCDCCDLIEHILTLIHDKFQSHNGAIAAC